LAAVDGAVAGDHAVAERAGGVQSEVRRPVPGQRIDLHERALVEQLSDALARSQLALGVHALDGLGTDGLLRLLHAIAQVGEFSGGGVDVDRARTLWGGGARR